MIKKAVIIPIFVVFLQLIPIHTIAQNADNKSFAWYDSTTYSRYLLGDWDNVISEGKLAMQAGHDYLYLRLRMGFAYYYTENYRAAAQEFSKALGFNSADTLAAHYFNLSCQYGGRESEVFQAKNIPRQNKTIESIGALFGWANYPSGTNFSITDSTQVYREIDYPNFLSYMDFGIKLNIKSNVSIFLAANQYQIDASRDFDYYSTDASRDSTVTTDYGYYHTYKFQSKLQNKETDIHTNQKAFYLQGIYFPARGIKLVPAFQLLSIHKSGEFAIPDSTLKTDTAWFNKLDTTWQTFDYYSSGYRFNKTDTSYFDYVASLSVYQDVGNFNLGLTGSLARLYNKKVTQLGASAMWYPFGNTNLYAGASITRKFSKLSKGMVSNLLVGTRVLKRNWVEVSYTFGKLVDYNELNSYLVFNQPYTITSRMGINLYSSIQKNIILSFGYRYSRLQTNLLTYNIATDGITEQATHPSFNYMNFNGGLKWKF